MKAAGGRDPIRRDAIFGIASMTKPIAAAAAIILVRSARMCRNIKTLANFEPAASDEEIRAAALQFVRKLSGAPGPSRANEAAFNGAVDEVASAAHRLIRSLRAGAAPRNREEELRKARERTLRRFA